MKLPQQQIQPTRRLLSQSWIKVIMLPFAQPEYSGTGIIASNDGLPQIGSIHQMLMLS